jgi:PAS domain S-box-containing protein
VLEAPSAGRADSPPVAAPIQLHSLLDALPAAIYTTNADGRITYFNQAAADLSGRQPVIGEDLWCVSWHLCRPDGTPLPHEECPMAIAIRERRPVRGVEILVERPDGSRLPVMPYPTPLFGDDGRLSGAVNMLVDLSEMRRAEAEAAYLAAIVSSSDDAVISKTLGGVVTSWNAGATRVFGYEAAEMIGQPITRIIPAELHEEEERILRRLRRGEHIDHFETVRIAKGGRRVDVSLTVSPVRDKSGALIGASKIARDISERKEAERSRQLLIDELNHRVKNTLATVQAIAQHTLRRAARPADFVAGFNSRLQSLSRVHSTLSSSHWRGADLGDLVRDQLLHGPIDESRVSARGPAVWLGPQMALHLALVVHELGTNACKHGALSAPGGRISVDWTVGTGTLNLRWVERGNVRPATSMPRGFGVGLVERSMKAHGGNAQMRWAPEGIEWELTLPLPDEQAAADSRSAARDRSAASRPEPRDEVDGPVGPPLAGKRILVVEDEPLLVQAVVANLEDAGAEIAGAAATPEEALELIEVGSIDAALLDVNLRGRPVDAVAAALTRRDIPFLFVTGYGRGSLPRPFREAPFLAKPFLPDELVVEVDQLLRARSGAAPWRAGSGRA